MKKFLLFVLVLMMMLPLLSVAQSKYEGMTFEQLQEEYLAILQAMWKTEKWQEVKVTPGVYQVGVEIPAGEWTISSDGSAIYVGTKLNKTKTEIDGDYYLAIEYVDREFANGWTILLEDGMFITISDAVIFTPPVKGQGFTFK